MTKLTELEKNIIAEENVNLARKVAHKFKNTPIPYDDLFSVANLGFTKALNAYESDRGAKFSTFAYNCMINEILFYLRKERKHGKNISFSTVLSVDKNGNDFELESIIEDFETKTIEEDYETSEDNQAILDAIMTLNPQEQEIMFHRYELNGYKAKTQKEIATEIGMSQANVSKIQKNCIEKIKKHIRKNYLYS